MADILESDSSNVKAENITQPISTTINDGLCTTIEQWRKKNYLLFFSSRNKYIVRTVSWSSSKWNEWECKPWRIAFYEKVHCCNFRRVIITMNLVFHQLVIPIILHHRIRNRLVILIMIFPVSIRNRLSPILFVIMPKIDNYY